MLIIRREQMDALQKAVTTTAELRLAESLRHAHPEACARQWDADADGRQARAFVRAGTAAAARYGVSAERELRLFLSMRLNLGADFENRPECAWMQPILRDPALDGAKKIQLIAAQIAHDARRRTEIEAAPH